jgi:uncharacterized membrane protein YphA (DoxX/SURF4 family)
MNIALWIIQILLAVAFLIAGVTKLTRPSSKLRAGLPEFHPTVIRLISVAEILGALALILPGVTGIATVLTPTAAAGLVIIMAGAVVTHARRREGRPAAMNAVLLVLALIVAIGRFGPFPL